ncbi:MAG: hypothetical protein KBS73_07625 [Bacteroidales bacterium]|nr:hypothetical protein [Candidatus Cacconaster equifaecalis]
MKIGFEELKATIAHEWGHCLMYHLLGYGRYVEDIEIEANISGLFGRTRVNLLYADCIDINNPVVHLVNIPAPDNLVILYAGVIAEGNHKGQKINISNTDAERAKALEQSKRKRSEARKRASDLLAPYSGDISKLVELTLKKEAYQGEINYLKFYDRIFAYEVRQYLKGII